MAGRSAGIKGSAVLAGTAGLYLVYVGVKDIPFFDCLRQLVRKETPKPRAEHDKFAFQSGGNSDTSGGAVTASSGPPTGKIVRITGTTISVDSSIEGSVTALMQKAERDGLTELDGGGYRTHLAQATLRVKNGCTCSNSSKCCRVMTAPVGQSEHEKGLAIDFTIGGRSVSRKFLAGQVAFKWLQDNAGQFGLRNLPGEDWHWSTTGK